MHSNTQNQEVATQRQTLSHAEDIENKKIASEDQVLFAWLLDLSHQLKYAQQQHTPNHTLQHIHAGTQDASKSNGWSS